MIKNDLIFYKSNFGELTARARIQTLGGDMHQETISMKVTLGLRRAMNFSIKRNWRPQRLYEILLPCTRVYRENHISLAI